MTTSSSSSNSEEATSNSIIRFDVVPRIGDLLRVQRGILYRRGKFLFWLAVVLFITSAIFPLLPMTREQSQSLFERYWAMRAMMAFPFFIPCVVPTLMYFTARRFWTRSAELHEPRSIEITNEELRIRGKTFEYSTAWSNVSDAILFGDQLVVTTTQKGIHIVSLSDQTTGVRDAVLTRVACMVPRSSWARGRGK